MIALTAPEVARVRWRQVAGVGTVAGLILGVLGPFGSYLDGGILSRSAYWVGSTWLGIILYGSGVVVVGRLMVPRWQHLGLLSLIVLAASIPETVSTRAAAFAIWPRLRQYDPGWWIWYVQASTIGAVTVAVAALMTEMRVKRASRACQTVPEYEARSPRADRPSRLPIGVIALQMEDHYVRAHTRAGSTLVQMKLSHAIAELAETEGLRTHRSWWVARGAVLKIDGSPRAMRLRLHNGLSVPVARSAVAALREAGWLQSQQDRTPQ